MPKSEKILRVNVPFRILPESLEMLRELAENDSRTPASMFEKIIKESYFKVFPKRSKGKG